MESTVATRLKHFMDFKEISITQFADTCGIPRPTLSQLLSGRNKKLSDVIVKLIHERFPELSVLWLMFGEGEMLVPAPINPALVSEAEKFIDDLSDEEENQNLSELTSVNLQRNHTVNKVVNHQIANVNFSDKIDQKTEFLKKIRSITVFFDDGSYQEFFPSAKK